MFNKTIHKSAYRGLNVLISESGLLTSFHFNYVNNYLYYVYLTTPIMKSLYRLWNVNGFIFIVLRIIHFQDDFKSPLSLDSRSTLDIARQLTRYNCGHRWSRNDLSYLCDRSTNYSLFMLLLITQITRDLRLITTVYWQGICLDSPLMPIYGCAHDWAGSLDSSSNLRHSSKHLNRAFSSEVQ